MWQQGKEQIDLSTGELDYNSISDILIISKVWGDGDDDVVKLSGSRFLPLEVPAYLA